MINRLKQFTRRSKTAVIAYRIFDNWRTGRRFRAGRLEFSSGSTHAQKTLDASVSYVKSVFSDYLTYCGLGAGMLEGKRVLEIGHGDSLGVALMFLGAGAARVTCIDKFYPFTDAQQQQRIYRALRDELDEAAKSRINEAIDIDREMQPNPQKLKCIHGVGIEEARGLFDVESFDLIVSRGVLEYSQDGDRAFSVMDSLLSPGGYMVHKIDLRDDGMFSSRRMHPLTFLTISDAVYRLMTDNSGRCNRKLSGYYRQKMIDLAYDSKLFVTCMVGYNKELVPHDETIRPDADYFVPSMLLVDEIRPSLSSKYRHLSDEELAISGIFLAARKPGWAASVSDCSDSSAARWSAVAS